MSTLELQLSKAYYGNMAYSLKQHLQPRETCGNLTFQFNGRRLIYSGNSVVHLGDMFGGIENLLIGERVCKLVAGEEDVKNLENEANIYATKLGHLQGQAVPRCYGIFEGTVNRRGKSIPLACLVLEYCGRSPSNLDTSIIKEEARKDIVAAMLNIHKAGIWHGDFKAANVAIREQGSKQEIRIIDFDHAIEHTCGCKWDKVLTSCDGWTPTKSTTQVCGELEELMTDDICAWVDWHYGYLGMRFDIFESPDSTSLLKSIRRSGVDKCQSTLTEDERLVEVDNSIEDYYTRWGEQIEEFQLGDPRCRSPEIDGPRLRASFKKADLPLEWIADRIGIDS